MFRYIDTRKFGRKTFTQTMSEHIMDIWKKVTVLPPIYTTTAMEGIPELCFLRFGFVKT